MSLRTAALLSQLLVACGRPMHVGVADDGSSAHAPPDSRFDGIRFATWQPGDRFELRWDPPAGRTVQVRARAPDGTLLKSWSTTQSSLTVHLPDAGTMWFDAALPDGTGADIRLQQWSGENRLVALGNYDFRGGMDVAGEGTVAVLAGGTNDTVDAAILDVSNPAHPSLLGTITGVPEIRDVHLEDGILYSASDCVCMPGDARWEAWSGVGVRIHDLSDPTRPVELATIGGDDASVHNLYVEDGLLYLVSLFEPRVAIYDITEPASPVLVGTWSPGFLGALHDVVARGRTAWVVGPFGMVQLDVTDPGAPVVQMLQTSDDLDRRDPSDTGGAPPPHGPDEAPTDIGFHNLWPSEDGQFFFTSREVVGGRLEIWDAMDLSHIEPIAAWPADEPNSIHNVHVWGDYAFAAWYHDGLRVLDVSDPWEPTLIGNIETNNRTMAPIDRPDIRGAWGIWPYGKHVLGGDTDTGLWVAEFHPIVVGRDGPPLARIPRTRTDAP